MESKMIGRWIALTAVFVVCVSSLLGACSGSNGSALLSGSPDGSAGGHACVPGQQIGCACSAGAIGAQVCRADGTGFGTCLGCTLPDGAPVGPPLPGSDGGIDPNAGEDGGGVVPGSDSGPPPVACSPGATTTISGTVYDPAGRNPLYGVSVYVPRDPPPAFPTGATCSCNGLYPLNPITIAQTDPAGKFTLQNVPDQPNVTIVLQVGKWRMQVPLAITPCQANPQPDRSLTLPKNHLAGDIPQIALSTGSADSLECLLLRVGLDASEYGGGASGAGHIHIFQVGGTSTTTSAAPNTSPPGPASSASLWGSQADLMSYDMVFLSCEGIETTGMNQAALFNYAAAGGRVFASHFHYAWLNTGPFAADNMASWTSGANDLGNINASIITTLPGGGSFKKGQALLAWLGGLKVLVGGQLPIQQARENAYVSPANAPAQPWLSTGVTSDAGTSVATQYFSYNTKTTTAPQRECGRVVYSDIHVGAASNDYGGGLGLTSAVVPTGCTAGPLSAQEDALEFMLFDLSGCVTVDQ